MSKSRVIQICIVTFMIILSFFVVHRVFAVQAGMSCNPTSSDCTDEGYSCQNTATQGATPEYTCVATINWNCSLSEYREKKPGCIVFPAISEDEMKGTGCNNQTTNLQTVERGKVFSAEIKIDNPGSKLLVFSCVNCSPTETNYQKTLRGNPASTVLEWKTDTISPTTNQANFQLQVEIAEQQGSVLYGNICVQVENPPPTLADLGIVPSVLCRSDSDCGGGTIFRCDKAPNQPEGKCEQWKECTTSIECIQALGQNDAVCNTRGGCEIHNPNDPTQSQIDPSGNNSGSGSGNIIGCREGQDCVQLINPLPTTDIPVIIGKAISVVMGIIGSITLVIFLYGGFLWLTSAGNSEKIAKGMQAMLWAGIGIIVVFSSYAILTLILNTLQQTP